MRLFLSLTLVVLIGACNRGVEQARLRAEAEEQRRVLTAQVEAQTKVLQAERAQLQGQLDAERRKVGDFPAVDRMMMRRTRMGAGPAR